MTASFGHLWSAGFIVIALTLSTACGGSDDSPSSKATPVPAIVQAPAAPALEVATLAFKATQGATFFGFETTLSVKNPATRTVGEAEADVQLVDAAGKVVGTNKVRLPAIGPGETYLFYGLGNSASIDKLHTLYWDDGIPANARMVLTKQGTFADGPGDQLPAKDVTFTPGPAAGEYNIQGTITIQVPTRAGEIDYKGGLLRAADGKIVGFGIGSVDTRGQPALIPPGTQLTVTIPGIKTTGVPARGEVSVYKVR